MVSFFLQKRLQSEPKNLLINCVPLSVKKHVGIPYGIVQSCMNIEYLHDTLVVTGMVRIAFVSLEYLSVMKTTY